MTYGIPFGAPAHTVPKSGCAPVLLPTWLTHWLDIELSGYCEMSVFHQLSAGKSWQPPSVAMLPLLTLPVVPLLPVDELLLLDDDDALELLLLEDDDEL